MVVDRSNLIDDDPELAPVLSGTYLPTMEKWKVELAELCKDIGTSVGITSMGNQTQVSLMETQWFTNYAIASWNH